MKKLVRKIKRIYGNIRCPPKFYKDKLEGMKTEPDGSYFGKLLALSRYYDWHSTLSQENKDYLKKNLYKELEKPKIRVGFVTTKR